MLLRFREHQSIFFFTFRVGGSADIVGGKYVLQDFMWIDHFVTSPCQILRQTVLSGGNTILL